MTTGFPDLAFQWLETVQYSYLDVDPYGPAVSKFPAFSNDVTEHLFKTKMTTMDFENISLAGFRMYRRFFLSVNSRHRLLRRMGENEFRVRDFNLIGLDAFWAMGLTAVNKSVAKEALSNLRNIYENVSKKLRPVIGEKRSEFVLKCVDHLKAAFEEYKQGAEKSTNAICVEKCRRCLTLLNSIVAKDNRSRDPNLVHGVRARRAVEKANQNKPSTTDPDPEKDSLNNSDDDVAAAAMSSALASSSENHTNDTELEEKKEKSFTDVLRPGDVLAESFFSMLFSLLTVTEVQDQVWDLLMSLPTNASVLNSIINLTEDDNGTLEVFERLSKEPSGSYIFHLLYIMQIIRHQLNDEEWIPKFIASGGLSCLVDIFSNKDLLTKENGDFGKQAMSHLVESLNELFSSGQVDSEKLSACLSTNFVQRLMEQISELAVRKPEISQTTDTNMVIEPESSVATKKGTRIANCHYGASKWNLNFEITGGEHYQVAVYVVDYNTNRRAQSMVAWLGNDKTLGNPPEGSETHPHAVKVSGPDFHNGQWVVWDVHGSGTFNITIRMLEAPNWVISALLIDKSPHPLGAKAPLDPYPSLVTVDSETQGKWRGKYGAYGGVLLGIKDYIVPPRPGLPSTIPHLESFNTNGCDKYEWVSSLTCDPRGMQQAPNQDEVDYYSTSDEESDDEDIVDRRGMTRQLNSEKSVESSGSKSTETSRALLEMLVASVLDREDLLESVLEYPALKKWLMTCLILCPDLKLREGVVQGINRLCKTEKCTKFFLDQLLDFLNEMEKEEDSGPNEKEEEESKKDYTQYFSLLHSLLCQTSSYDSVSLFERLCRMLQKHGVTEDDDKPENVDSALVGYLHILSCLLKIEKKVQAEVLDLPQKANIDLIEEIFHNCLFGIPASRHDVPIPKCRSDGSRSAAFKLLLLIAEFCGGYKDMLQRISSYVEGAPFPTDFSIDVCEKQSDDQKTQRTHYVGLKNQGCTCYMNSLLQQLFIIPSLRNDILNVKLPEEKASIMYQIQSLFAYMQESKSKYVDTIDFCRTVKLMGEPIVLSRQEDANEFFNALADQVEPFIKATPQEQMFRDTFGGVLINQIISSDCPHFSNRPQEFLTISLKVQSKRDIHESLDFYVAADILDGNNKWKCEECDKHVTAKKRACIQHLPNTLALHLIRFEFDYQTFREVKVNDRFEFPTHLNMKPYTKEGIDESEGVPVSEEDRRPDDYYEYDLVGVLIHSGTAHSGHYYSYIRERVPSHGTEPQWFEFNDRDVTPFNPADIPNQAFGGNYADSYRSSEKSYSAYMLFYERKNTYAAGKYEKEPLHMGSVALDVSQERTVEPAILDTIFRDSIVRAQQKQLMTSPTLGFLWSVVEIGCKSGPSQDMSYKEEIDLDFSDSFVRSVTLGTRVLFEIFTHCVDNLQIKQKFEFMAALYEKSERMAVWFLDVFSDPENLWMKTSLLNCPDCDIREAAATLVSACIRAVSVHEQSFYNELVPVEPKMVIAEAMVEEVAEKKDDDNKNNKKEEKPTRPRSRVVRTVNRLTALLTSAADMPAQKTQQMLIVLLNFANIGKLERGILMDKNAISDLIALYDTHRVYDGSRYSSSGSSQSQTNVKFLPLIELLAVLLCGCDNPGHELHYGEPGIPAETGVQVPLDSLKKLFEKGFLCSVLKQPHLLPPMEKIFNHWLYNHEEYSSVTIKSVCQIIDSLYTPSSREPYFDFLFTLLNLQDEKTAFRIELCMSCVVRT